MSLSFGNGWVGKIVSITFSLLWPNVWRNNPSLEGLVFGSHFILLGSVDSVPVQGRIPNQTHTHINILNLGKCLKLCRPFPSVLLRKWQQWWYIGDTCVALCGVLVSQKIQYNVTVQTEDNQGPLVPCPQMWHMLHTASSHQMVNFATEELRLRDPETLAQGDKISDISLSSKTTPNVRWYHASVSPSFRWGSWLRLLTATGGWESALQMGEKHTY